MLIRQENKNDHKEVYNLIQAAFATAMHSDGNEQDLVTALRNGDAFIPELSLIAECDGIIVGHILFTKIQINGQTELALAPLSVHPKYQRQGIGTALIKEGHKIAQELNYDYSIVLGDEHYYPRTGYLPALQYGIHAPFEVPSQNFMAYPLKEDVNPISGIVTYPAEFGIN